MLSFHAITKTFPGVKALDGVSFSVAGGSVHALLGENGAGKSTLLRILAGVHPADSGRLEIDGKPRRFGSAAEALAAGVAVIYQELHLVPQATVAENLFLGHLPHRAGMLDRRTLRERTQTLLKGLGLGLDLDPDSRVGDLSIGRRQMVEVAKALSRDARIFAFDEPTSSLSAPEVDALFAVIGDLRRRGCAILYVSHRLDEIERICDAATVLRDGRHVATHEQRAGVSHATLVHEMVGRAIEDVYGYRPRPLGQTVLGVRGLEGPGLAAPADFAVRGGEIVGLFGLVGAGRTELLKLIGGARAATRGEVEVDGRIAHFKDPRAAIRSGVVLCPEDRREEALIPGRSVVENLAIGRRNLATGALVRPRAERAAAEAAATRLDIRGAGLHVPVKVLSGGNQQKVVLGRWLETPLRAILLDEPTRGVDVGAKSELYEIVRGLAERGLGVVFASSDLPEVLGVCDRVLVMRQGRIVADVARADATPEGILTAALPVGDGTDSSP